VGVPDADFGEVGVAVVVPKPGTSLDSAALVARLKSTLANFKVPKRCYVVDELPRNAMGKVQKNVLRDRYAAR
jgi:malonyl-CoA/methylmalonyl-CoA synthetase